MAQKGLYRHYKGGLYELIGCAKHTETLEEMIVYRSLASDDLWIRPKEMFFETILIDGHEVDRFTFVGSA